MPFVLVAVCTMTSMVPAAVDATYTGPYTRPPPGHKIPRSMKKPDYAVTVEHDITVDAMALRGRQKDAADQGTMELGGVHMVAQQVPLHNHPKVARAGKSSLAPSTPLRQRQNLTHRSNALQLSNLTEQASLQQPSTAQPSSMWARKEKEFPTTALPANNTQTQVQSVEEEEEGTRHPPLHGIVAAVAASLGWGVLMLLKCKGFIHELSPKSPLTGFMRSHLERRTSANGQSRRNHRKSTARFCPTRFNSQVPQAIGPGAQFTAMADSHSDRL